METEPFPGATFTPAPEYKSRDEKSRRLWMDWSHIDFAMFHTKVQHSDRTEYQHYEECCGSLLVYKDHAELRIPQGLVRYELNPEFIEKLNWIDWEATKAKRGEKIKQIIADMKKQPVADLSSFSVSIGHLRCPDHRNDRTLFLSHILKSDLKHWKYFDECTLHQCVKHVIEDNYSPEESPNDSIDTASDLHPHTHTLNRKKRHHDHALDFLPCAAPS